MIKHKILIKANMAIALCLSIFFVGANQENIITQTSDSTVITVKDLKIEKSQLIIDFNKKRYETLKELYGEENKETKQAELDWKISVINLKITQLKD